MALARIYILHAQEGHDATVETALNAVADALRAMPGSEGIELLRDAGNERRFIFIERWESVETHTGALASIPSDVMDTLMAALDGPPDGAYFDYLRRA